jgi:ElaB/YqjD/DUF883 family membrane-anchored ribosome-binding protein
MFEKTGLTTLAVLLHVVLIMDAMESFNKNYRDDTPGVGVDSHDMSEQSGEHPTLPNQQEIQEKVTGQINQAIDTTSEKLNQLADKMENSGQAGSTSVGKTVHKVADQVRRGADTLESTSAEKLGEQVQDAIRDRPLTSISIALGVGFLLSQLFKR